MESLPERGQLDAVPLPRLLLALHEQRFSGTLRLARDRTEKRVRLLQGVPVLAESNLPSESLATHLLDVGQISRDDHARLADAVRERGRTEEQAVLALGLLDAKALVVALRQQARSRLLECFGWPRGEYELEAGAAAANEAAALHVDPLVLVRDGIEKHWTVDGILNALGDNLMRFPVRTARWESVRRRLSDREELGCVFDALDGSSTLADALKGGATPGALATMWLLDATGALAFRETAESEASQEDGAAASAEAPELEIVIESTTAAGPGASQPASASAEAPSASAADSAPSFSKRKTPTEDRRASAAAEALRAEIQDKHQRLGSLDHYQLLGVARDANAARLKRAYLVAAKRFHPDTLARLALDDLKAQANAVFAQMSRANRVLSDPGERRNYDAALEGGAEVDGTRLVQAETQYRKGEMLLRAGNFAGAIEFLEPAVKLWPEEAVYQAALGWALHKKNPPDPERARQHLERAVALDERNAVAHRRLSVVLRSLGEADAAARTLALAKKLDPNVR